MDQSIDMYLTQESYWGCCVGYYDREGLGQWMLMTVERSGEGRTT